jgi:hypothetical protein
MKPDPAPPPVKVLVLIETTDGKTRCAIPATESGARSIVLVDETKFAERKSEPPAALTPRKPPRDPARSAIKTRVPAELFGGFGASHHGLDVAWLLLFRGNIMFIPLHLGCYE